MVVVPRLTSLFALVALVAGCVEKSENAGVPGLSAGEVSVLRSQLMLAVEPPAANTVIELRDTLAEAPEDMAAEQVAVVGQIGGMPNPYGEEVQPNFPWVDGQAVFFLVDPTTAEEFEGHEHEEGEECSFCLGKARKLVNTVAMVELHGEGEQAIPARADHLLGLAEGDTVVVTGVPRRELDMLVIDARGVYVKPDDQSAEVDSKDGESDEVVEQTASTTMP